MRILLTGRYGQVGWELERALPALGEVIATGRSQLDLANFDQVRRIVRESRPGVIVNAAAYTAVDKAESEQELAMRINGEAPGVLGTEAARLGALLVHFSTDYVFDGEKSGAYMEEDAPNPLNVYGRTKLAGEQAVRVSGCRSLIFRTSWVYAGSGKNFLLTMLRLAKEGKPLPVVDDVYGAPTASHMIARATADAISQALQNESRCGLYHMSAQGRTTWCGFARAIVATAGLAAEVVAISTEEYSAPARRPRNSILDNAKIVERLGIRLASWQAGMSEVLGRLRL